MPVEARRSDAQRVWRELEATRRLLEIASDRRRLARDSLSEALRLAADLLGCDVGELLRSEAAGFTLVGAWYRERRYVERVAATVAVCETSLADRLANASGLVELVETKSPGSGADARDRVCSRPGGSDRVSSLPDGSERVHWRLGLPVRHRGSLFGVLAFGAYGPATGALAAEDREFADFFGGWLEKALERQQLERQQIESERRLELALWSTDLGLWDYDLEHGRIAYDGEWAQMLGYDDGEISQDLEDRLRLVHPEDRPAVLARLGAHLDGETPFYESLHRLKAKDGEWKWILDRGKAVERDERGRVTRLIGTQRDVTQERRAEEQRRRLEQQIRDSQKLESLGVLAGGIAHDFNNLLTGILGNAQLARTTLSTDAEAVPFLDRVEVTARRAAELSRQMLDYSGRGRMVIEAIDVGDIFRELADLLQASISKKVELKLELDEGLPPVAGDSSQIRQVFLNLLTNASEAVGDKRGVITVRSGVREYDHRALLDSVLGPECSPGEYVYCEVEDSGLGIDQETLGRVFDPFFTTKFTGRGLGLATVLGIVRGHGGALQVKSVLGAGSVFRVLLPPAMSARLSEPGKVRTTAVEGRGTVLVADDEPEALDVARAALEVAGFSVLSAPDGRQAVELFKRHADEISVVLLDLAMPQWSGSEALVRIRRLGFEVPAILCSGYTEECAQERSEEADFDAFLQKPYEIYDLQSLVVELSERNASHGESAVKVG